MADAGFQQPAGGEAEEAADFEKPHRPLRFDKLGKKDRIIELDAPFDGVADEVFLTGGRGQQGNKSFHLLLEMPAAGAIG
jgi:hypothetical protein